MTTCTWTALSMINTVVFGDEATKMAPLMIIVFRPSTVDSELWSRGQTKKPFHVYVTTGVQRNRNWTRVALSESVQNCASFREIPHSCGTTFEGFLKRDGEGRKKQKRGMTTAELLSSERISTVFPGDARLGNQKRQETCPTQTFPPPRNRAWRAREKVYNP